MKKLYEKAKKKIDGAKNILLISHKKPDADTLGAALCFKIWFSKKKKNVTLACVDEPSGVFDFLPYVNEFVNEFEIKNFDLIIFLDVGASYMTNFHLKYENIFKSEIFIINIDHHASNDNFGDINIVDKTAPSTTTILYRMLKYWHIEIDENMATCLLAGIYGDTGSFMHSNTTKEVYEISSELLKCGAEIANISKALFNNNSVSTLKLWGKVLEKSVVTKDNVVLSVIKENDYDDVGADSEQLSGVIDYLNMIPGSKFAVLINEDRKGNVKGSFRTQNDKVDLSRIASVFGGGGHPKASGFSIRGRLQEDIRYRIVSEGLSKKTLEF